MEGNIFTDVCFDLTSRDAFNQLILDGWLAPLVTKKTYQELDVSGVRTSGGEFVAHDLQRAVDITAITQAAVEEIVYYGKDRKHWLVFASGIEHAQHIAECLDLHGIRCGVLTSHTTDAERATLLQRYKAGAIRAMVNMNILCLDMQTEILGEHGWLKAEEITYETPIASYHLSGEITFAPPKFIVRRDLTADEVFIRGKGCSMAYRVTGNHRMLVKWASGRSWKVLPAEDLVGSTHYQYPVSGLTKVLNPSSLSLDECSFIGFWLGDGHLSKRKKEHGYGWTCSLSQSTTYPLIINWVDTLLRRLELGYSRHTVQSKPNLSIRWTINTPSWKKYSAYLHKEGCLELFTLSTEQFASLMHGFWLADGLHGNGFPAKKKCWGITGTQKALYDILHAVGTARGYCMTLTPIRHPAGWQHKQQYCLRWKKTFVSSLTATNAPHSERLPEDRESWCVTSDTGFIVTRHSGRTTIVGNTTGFDFPGIDLIGMLRPTKSAVLWIQALGRGTRPSPDKKNCLVLDFAGNTRRLGPINDPILPGKKGAKVGGQAPYRVCPTCLSYCHASARICPDCGQEFPREAKLATTAYTDEVIAQSAPQIAPFKVDKVIYSVHEKTGKPPSLQVSYYCGLRLFREWVCVEHDGYAGRKALEWWRARSNEKMPDTVKEAAEAAEHLPVPKTIDVWVNTKYPTVTNYAFT
jgi:superfamily II DNA/RNA helicase